MNAYGYSLKFGQNFQSGNSAVLVLVLVGCWLWFFHRWILHIYLVDFFSFQKNRKWVQKIGMNSGAVEYREWESRTQIPIAHELKTSEQIKCIFILVYSFRIIQFVFSFSFSRIRTFSPTLRPVCLWSVPLLPFVKKNGVVEGDVQHYS